MKIECYIIVKDYDEFIQLNGVTVDRDDRITIGKSSDVVKSDNPSPLEESDLIKEHIRDNGGDSIGEFLVKLDTQDINTFISIIEESSQVICDLIDDRNLNARELILSRKELNKYTTEYIKDNLEDEKYTHLRASTLSNLPVELFEKYPDKFNWDTISFLDISDDFIVSNKERLNWDIIATSGKGYGSIPEHVCRVTLDSSILKQLPEDIRRQVEIDSIIKGYNI